MSVESFDPAANTTPVNAANVGRLLEASSAAAPDFGLQQLERARLAPLMTAAANDWQAAVADLTSADLVSLVRFLTLAEEAISGWQAGAKSPVISLVKVLKSRGDYPKELTAWIKANTNNRFLPHGSLMDRL